MLILIIRSRRLTGPLLPGKVWSHKLLAVSVDGSYIFSGGYWDNSLRVHNLGTENASPRVIPAHYGEFLCFFCLSSNVILNLRTSLPITYIVVSYVELYKCIT